MTGIFNNLNTGMNQNNFSSLGNYGLSLNGLTYGQDVPDLAEVSAGTTVATTPGAGGIGDWFSRSALFGGKDPSTGAFQGGWAMPAIAAGGSVLQGLMGMKQYGLAQDQFKESKRQYNQNYAAQRQTINTQLEDRQRARVASNPGAYQSVSDYLDKNKVV